MDYEMYQYVAAVLCVWEETWSKPYASVKKAMSCQVQTRAWPRLSLPWLTIHVYGKLKKRDKTQLGVFGLCKHGALEGTAKDWHSESRVTCVERANASLTKATSPLMVPRVFCTSGQCIVWLSRDAEKEEDTRGL